jgi:hypothetical protein
MVLNDPGTAGAGARLAAFSTWLMTGWAGVTLKVRGIVSLPAYPASTWIVAEYVPGERPLGSA